VTAARPLRAGAWRVWLAAGGPAEARRWLDLVERAAAHGAPVHRSKHADTYRSELAGMEVYVKRYRRYRRRTVVKDLLRASKAQHVVRISRALAAAGFHVPRVLAAGEERWGPVVRGAWVATAALEGAPLAERVAERSGGAAPALAAKRAVLAAVGHEVARLHAAGFVAGDLVPANVWVAAEGDRVRVALLDHDRTRAGRPPAPWVRARRNLVQLNRVVLTGIAATDRLRVYRAYACARGWSHAQARRRLGWLIAKTIERRIRFDHLPASARRLGFRALMRAEGVAVPPAASPPRPPRRARGRR
jgi:tRNA A-37 threonylcarbamoyl transferase component Bud32